MKNKKNMVTTIMLIVVIITIFLVKGNGMEWIISKVDRIKGIIFG